MSVISLTYLYTRHTLEKPPKIESIFPAPVSGTCVMQIWDWIRLVPGTGAD